MKILVATTKTQGQRRTDFCFVPEGEPLRPGFECEREKVDGRCGCRRSLSGVDCLKATSTMLVTEVPHDRDWLVGLFARSLRGSGFRPEPKDVEALADDMLAVAANFPAGAVLERRGHRFQARKV